MYLGKSSSTWWVKFSDTQSQLWLHGKFTYVSTSPIILDKLSVIAFKFLEMWTYKRSLNKLLGPIFGIRTTWCLERFFPSGTAKVRIGIITALEKQTFTFQNFDQFQVSFLTAAKSSKFPKPLSPLHLKRRKCAQIRKSMESLPIPRHSERSFKFVTVIIFTVLCSYH